MHKRTTSRIMSSRLYQKILQEEILSTLHEGITGGHLGIDKTLNRLKECFYRPGHYEDVRNLCQTCAVCASRKAPSIRSRAPLTSIKMGYPLQIVAMDIMGPFPISFKGNWYILVVSDYFTRWVEAFADQLATTAAHRLTNKYFSLWPPRTVAL